MMQRNWNAVRYCCCQLVTQSCPALLQPRGLQPTKLFYPWDFPGKNTGVGCHFLLQGIFQIGKLPLALKHLEPDKGPHLVEFIYFPHWPQCHLKKKQTTAAFSSLLGMTPAQNQHTSYRASSVLSVHWIPIHGFALKSEGSMRLQELPVNTLEISGFLVVY